MAYKISTLPETIALSSDDLFEVSVLGATGRESKRVRLDNVADAVWNEVSGDLFLVALEEDVDILLTDAMAASAVQIAINTIPKNLNGHILDIKFADGDYDFDQTIDVKQFTGGTIQIQGNEAEDYNDPRLTQAVHINYSGPGDNAISVQCSCPVIITNLNVIIPDSTGKTALRVEGTDAKIMGCYLQCVGDVNETYGIKLIRGAAYVLATAFENFEHGILSTAPAELSKCFSNGGNRYAMTAFGGGIIGPEYHTLTGFHGTISQKNETNGGIVDFTRMDDGTFSTASSANFPTAQSVKTYVNDIGDQAIAEAGVYSDGLSADMKSYVDTQDDTHLASANTYTDTATADMKSYVDTQDDTHLASANTYTDTATADMKSYVDGMPDGESIVLSAGSFMIDTAGIQTEMVANEAITLDKMKTGAAGTFDLLPNGTYLNNLVDVGYGYYIDPGSTIYDVPLPVNTPTVFIAFLEIFGANIDALIQRYTLHGEEPLAWQRIKDGQFWSEWTVVVNGILDEDDMGSNSDEYLATQQSIKKYVDDQFMTGTGHPLFDQDALGVNQHSDIVQNNELQYGHVLAWNGDKFENDFVGNLGVDWAYHAITGGSEELHQLHDPSGGVEVSATTSYNIGSFTGDNIITDDIRGIYVDCFINLSRSSELQNCRLFATYPDGERREILGSDVTRSGSTINVDIFTNINEVIFIPINKGQTTIEFMSVIDDYSNHEMTEFTIIGAQQIKTQALSPEVDIIHITGTLEDTLRIGGFVDSSMTSEVSLPGSYVWTSEHPAASATNWASAMPLTVNPDVTKTTIKCKHSWYSAGIEEMEFTTLTIDWVNNTIFGTQSSNYENVHQAHLYSTVLEGLHEFVGYFQSIPVTTKIGITGRAITQLPWPYIATYHTYNGDYEITHYKTLAPGNELVFESGWFEMKSQDGVNSFKEVTHNLGYIPGRVKVLTKAVSGDNAGYIFEAIGSAQADDDDFHNYGGLVFAYNENTVRLWAPDVTSSGDSDKGAIINVADGWGGDQYNTSDHTAQVKVKIWR